MIDKKIPASHLFFIAVTLVAFLTGALLLLVLGVSPGYAQTVFPEETPSPEPENKQWNTLDLPFTELEQPSFDLISPAVATVSFRIPYRWLLKGDNNFIDLNFDAYQIGSSLVNDSEPGTAVNNTLFTVYVDNVPAASFVPSAELNQTLRLPIPYEVLANPDKNNHEIKFVLQRNDCTNGLQTRLVIHNSSMIHLEYETQPPIVNLSDFPRPLVQEQRTPESLLILLPDTYNEADLSAAAAVAAAVGQSAKYPITLSVTTSSALTPTQLANQSVIAIGQPDKNAFITDLYERGVLPTRLTSGNAIVDVDNQPVPSDYGVLQEILSETSPDHVYLIVTGGSNEAVSSAARALSATGPDFGLRGDVAIIEAVQEARLVNDFTVSENFALADMGFRDITWSGQEQHSSSKSFTIPAAWDIQETAALTFSYIPSSALDMAQSSLRVELNGKIIGDAPLSQSQTGEQQQTIMLPVNDFRPGNSNRLTFIADLALDYPCSPLNAPQAWLRIPNNGSIFLPYEVNPDIEAEPISEEPFVTKPDLSDVLFVLPDEPTEADLYSLIQLAQMLGADSDGSGFLPKVQFASTIDTEFLSAYQVIALGRPSTNSLITSYNEQLPQPFLPGEDSLGQTSGELSYRLPQDFSLGVIQYLPAPWAPERPFVIVSGMTDEGLRWASDALATGELRGRLDGNLTFVQEDFVESFDLIAAKKLSDLEASSTAIAGAIEIVTVTPQPTMIAQATVSSDSDLETTSPLSQDDPASVSDRYQPPNTTSSTTTNMIVLLIGVGLLLIGGGALYTWRKSRGTDET